MITSRQQKILIIDEINYTRLVLDYALTAAGYKADTAQNSNEAMQHISAELPDLILLSFRVTDSSGVSGVSTLRALKDYFRLRLDIAQEAEPPIIVLSASRDTKQTHEVQSLGVSKVLLKPINMHELLDSVETTIVNKKNVVPQARKKILIFDGSVRSQQFLESVLVREMYDIETTDSETELLARIKDRKFDLSIIDLPSLEGDATEILQSIREMAEEMPIITVATSADQISQDRLKQLGMQMHFVKPLNVDVFRTEVDTLLGAQMEEETLEQTEQTEQAEQAEQVDHEPEGL